MNLIRLRPQTMHVYDVLASLAPVMDSYLGVGVQEGECVRSVVTAHPDIHMLALCDTWGPHHGGTDRGSHEHVERMLDSIGYPLDRVLWLDGPSQSLVPTLRQMFDLSYVDGDHSEPTAWADLCNVWPLTRKAMVVHDVLMPSVCNAFARFMAHQTGFELIEFGGWTGTAVVYRS